VGFLGQHLDGGVLVDGDGAAGDEELDQFAIVLHHLDDAGLEDGWKGGEQRDYQVI